MALATRMGVADYRATHDDRPERTELIDGEVVVTEAKLPHAHVQTELLVFDVRLEVQEAEVLSPPLLPGFAVEVGTLFGR